MSAYIVINCDTCHDGVSLSGPETIHEAEDYCLQHGWMSMFGEMLCPKCQEEAVTELSLP